MAKDNQLFDVHIFGIVRAKVCNVPAEGMREAIAVASEYFDFNSLNTSLPRSPGIHAAYVEAEDEPSHFAVEKAGNGDKKKPCQFTSFAPAMSGNNTVLVKIEDGPRLGDMHRLLQRIAAIKTEEEQDEDVENGEYFSNDEHVSNMNQVIQEARKMLGKPDDYHGTEVSW